MKRAGYEVREINPLETSAPTLLSGSRERSPYVLRLRSMWEGWRGDVIKLFPRAPGLPRAPQRYLANVAERYVADAYNSLSIEGYQVTEELIKRVVRGGWNPDADAADSKDRRQALAARGYYQAFNRVKASIQRILEGSNAGQVAHTDHHEWYGELFAPAVTVSVDRHPTQAAHAVHGGARSRERARRNQATREIHRPGDARRDTSRADEAQFEKVSFVQPKQEEA